MISLQLFLILCGSTRTIPIWSIPTKLQQLCCQRSHQSGTLIKRKSFEPTKNHFKYHIQVSPHSSFQRLWFDTKDFAARLNIVKACTTFSKLLQILTVESFKKLKQMLNYTKYLKKCLDMKFSIFYLPNIWLENIFILIINLIQRFCLTRILNWLFF